MFFDAGCTSPDVCTTQIDYPCVTIPAFGGSSCLGITGAICRSSCDCLSANCYQQSCDPGPPDSGSQCYARCEPSSDGGLCLSDHDCESGVCNFADGGERSAPGACCRGVTLGCSTNADCCPGLSCTVNGSCVASQCGECNAGQGCCLGGCGATPPHLYCVSLLADGGCPPYIACP